jgi:hypothetical protein
MNGSFASTCGFGISGVPACGRVLHAIWMISVPGPAGFGTAEAWVIENNLPYLCVYFQNANSYGILALR